MSFLVVANFKSNLTLAEVKSWLNVVKPMPGMVVAPSFPQLPLFTGKLGNWETGKHLCAQDVSPFPPGSYTGAVSAAQLKELGITYCIVGHSERRRYFHETAMDIANKINELLTVGITPIVCLEDRDIAPQFAALDPAHYNQCLYCFEPAGDIGGTTTATLPEIEAVHQKIASFVPDCRFMYGGSVNNTNIRELMTLNLAGVLVSTASLDPRSFISILHGSQE